MFLALLTSLQLCFEAQLPALGFVVYKLKAMRKPSTVPLIEVDRTGDPVILENQRGVRAEFDADTGYLRVCCFDLCASNFRPSARTA